MILSAALSLFGLGLLCWLLFSLTVHALAVFVAVSVGRAALEHGAGPIGAALTALAAGAVTIVASQIAFATTRSVPLRLALGAIHAFPAGAAGFFVLKGLGAIGGVGEIWTLVFAGIGGLVVGGTAWARIAALAGPEAGVPVVSHPFVAGTAANDG